MQFKLNEKQKEAIEILSKRKYNEVMFYGGSRSGKTFLLIYAIFVRAIKEPYSRHLIIRKSFTSVKRSIWLDTIPKVLSICFENKLSVKKNETQHFIKLKNKSEIWISGLDDAYGIEKILGTEYSTIYFNEVSEISFDAVQIAKTRLSQKNNLAKKAFYDSNPTTKSSWAYLYFEKKINPIDSIPLENAENVVSMQMNPIHNIENLDSNYLKTLETLAEKDKKRFLFGEYQDANDGQVYYSFSRDRHVFDEIKIKEGLTIFVGMDFNVNPMTAVLCQFYDEKLFVFDEIFLENSDTPKMCAELLKRGYFGATVIPDSTGKNRKTSGQSDFYILYQSGFKIIETINPYIIDRVNNVNRLFNENRILISKKCKKLINDLERVSWKNNELDKKSDPMLTHISDALGYACHKLMPMIQFNSGKFVSERLM